MSQTNPTMKRILGGREARGPRREKHNLQQNDANDDNNHNNHSSSLVGLPTQTDLPFYALARGIASTREISSVMTGVRKLAGAHELGLSVDDNVEESHLAQFDAGVQLLFDVFLGNSSKDLHKELLRIFDLLCGLKSPKTKIKPSAADAKPLVSASYANRFKSLFTQRLEAFVSKLTAPATQQQLANVGPIDSLLTNAFAANVLSAPSHTATLLNFYSNMIQFVGEQMASPEGTVRWSDSEIAASELAFVSYAAFFRVLPITEPLTQELIALIKSVISSETTEWTQASLSTLPQRIFDAVKASSSSPSDPTLTKLAVSLHQLLTILMLELTSRDTLYTCGFLVAIAVKLLLGSLEAAIVSLGCPSSIAQSWVQEQLARGIIGTARADDNDSEQSNQVITSCLDSVIAKAQPYVKVEAPKMSARLPFSSVRGVASSLSAIAHISILRGAVVSFSSDSTLRRLVLKPAPEACFTSLRSSPSSNSNAATILFEGLFPTLCYYAEGSSERYARFLAFRGLEAYFAEVIGLLGSSSADELANVKHSITSTIHEAHAVLWRNWEDPWDSIITQVRTVFKLLLDLSDACEAAYGDAMSDEDHQYGKQWIMKLTKQVLDLNWRKKGKYPVLGIVLLRLSTHSILELRPDFIKCTFAAMSYTSVGKQAAMLLEIFLRALKAEVTQKHGDDADAAEAAMATECYPLWVPAMIDALSDKAVCGYTVQFGLPMVLDLFPGSLASILRGVCATAATSTSTSAGSMDAPIPEDTVRAAIATLKVARTTALLEASQLPTVLEDMGCGITTNALVKSAITAASEELRLDTFWVLCHSRRMTEALSAFELEHALLFLHYNISECSHSFRGQVTRSLQTFCIRLRDSARHILKSLSRGDDETANKFTRSVVQFLNWIAQSFSLSCYASAPFQRKVAALETFNGVAAVFTPDQLAALQPAFDKCGVSLQFFTPATCELALNSLWDTYDAVRQGAYSLLSKAPAPLPGYDHPDKLSKVLRWSLSMLNSPRQRDCDSGALALRIIVQKFIREASWSIRCSLPAAATDAGASTEQQQQASEVTIFISTPSPSSAGDDELARETSLLEFMGDMMNVLRYHLQSARANLSYAALNTPIFGPLMAVRYLVGDVDLTQVRHLDQWRSLLSDQIKVASDISELALAQPIRYKYRRATTTSATTANENNEHNIDNGDDDDDSDDETMQQSGDAGEAIDDIGDVLTSDGAAALTAASESTLSRRWILVSAWLSAKEVAFLYGCLAKLVLPSGKGIDAPVSGLLADADLLYMGDLLVKNLLVLKHGGAVECTADGFQLICEAILGSRSITLRAFTTRWLNTLLDKIENTSRALLSTRRSAGLPFAFLALLRGEVLATAREHKIRPLMVHAMTQLLRIANTDAATANPSATDIRHQVHSLNVLRYITRDKILIDDIGSYAEDLLVCSVNRYASDHWSVRNSATMAFTTLVERVIGTKQKTDDGRALQGYTCSEFFARFPHTHPFLLRKLHEATQRLRSAAAGESSPFSVDVSVYLPPNYQPPAPVYDAPTDKHLLTSATGLYAMLVLLSRFAPARMDSPAELKYASSFVPDVVQCIASSDWQVRAMGAKALVPLVGSSYLRTLLQNLIASIPLPTTTPRTNNFYNFVHGLLLQVQAILRGHLHLLATEAKRDLVDQVMAVLTRPDRTWLASTASIGAPIASLYLDIILEFGVNQHTLLSPAAASGVAKIVARCYDIVIRAHDENKTVLERRLREEVMLHHARQVAARVLSAVVFSESVWQLFHPLVPSLREASTEGVLYALLQDTQYEVRLAVLKSLVHFTRDQNNLNDKKDDNDASATTNDVQFDMHVVQCVLLGLLGVVVDGVEPTFVESNAKCVGYIFKLLNLLRRPLPQSVLVDVISSSSSSSASASSSIWHKLSSLLADERASLPIRQYAIAFMGFVVAQVLQQQLSAPHLAIEFSRWVELCLHYSAGDQSVEWRRAVTDGAISAGHPFYNNGTSTTEPVDSVKTWEHFRLQYHLLALRVLQDDDIDLRLDVIAALPQMLPGLFPGGAPVCLSRGIEAIFEGMHSAFAHMPAYAKFLVEQLSLPYAGESFLNSIEDPSQVKFFLFDPEKNNMFIEPLYTSQLALDGILHLIRAQPSSTMMSSVLVGHQPDILRRLEQAVGWIRRRREQPPKAYPSAISTAASDFYTWQEPVFAELNRVLSAIYALIQCPESFASQQQQQHDEAKEQASAVADMERTVTALVALLQLGILHPLLRQLVNIISDALCKVVAAPNAHAELLAASCEAAGVQRFLLDETAATHFLLASSWRNAAVQFVPDLTATTTATSTSRKRGKKNALAKRAAAQ